MIARSRLLHYLTVILLLLVIGPGCARVTVEDSGAPVPERDLTVRLPDLSIRQFTPFFSVNDGTDDAATALAGIEARLFSVYLRQALTGSRLWDGVFTISQTAQPDGFILEGEIVYSGPDGLEVAARLRNAACNVEFSHTHTSVDEESPEARYREITDLIRSDITELMNRIASGTRSADCMAQSSGARNESGETGKPFAEILSESIETFWDIYYEDLIGPFSEFRKSGGGNTSTVLEQEQQVNEVFIRGVAATATAVLSYCTTRNVPHDTPLQMLLEVKPFSRYSSFQSVQHRTESLRQARELGLVIDDQPETRNPKLIVDGTTYILDRSLQEQNEAWRRMIIDLCRRPARPVTDG